ncbi:MAG: type III CRISPR-associated RAMP protein Csx7 [Thermoproteota archaeon]
MEVFVKYTAKSPLRIGSEKGKSPTSSVDLQVVTMYLNGTEVPFIPGSSLKGVFRSSSEFIARSYGINACMMGEGCKNNYDLTLQYSMKIGNVDSIVNTLSKYCLICKMFGSASYYSHVSFSDAYPKNQVPRRGVKTGIAIDRRSGAVRKGALYTVEFVMPGSEFEGSIKFLNLPNYAIGLISTVIDNLNLGVIKIGGFKSRGFGTVEVTPKELHGNVLVGSSYVSISEKGELSPLDEDDEPVKFSNASEFLGECKKVWMNYVRKKHSS